MRQQKSRPSYLCGDSRTAGQIETDAGAANSPLRSEYSTKRVSMQISESRPCVILGGMIALARRWEGAT